MALAPTRRRRVASLSASASAHLAAIWLSAAELPARPSADLTTRTPEPVVTEVPVETLPPNPLASDEDAERASGAPALEIADVDFDLAKIQRRRDELFPFLTLNLSFIDRIERTLAVRRRRLVNPYAARATAPASKPPLAIDRVALRSLIDRGWSRRERWRPFTAIATLVANHDANHGQAPSVLRAYTDQNLLQPYYDTEARDPRFWTMLGLAADHREFIGFVARFARASPTSRSTTELLFLLEELAHGSRDTLLMLTATDPATSLRLTHAKSREAYDLAVEIKAHYGEWLRARQLESPPAIMARYDSVRLRLLSTIVDSTPDRYRTADARFLAGAIVFEQNNLAGALRWWRGMEPQEGDSYAAAASEVLLALQLPEERRASELVRVLGSEHRRWLDFSEQRLRQFGHAFDTY